VVIRWQGEYRPIVIGRCEDAGGGGDEDEAVAERARQTAWYASCHLSDGKGQCKHAARCEGLKGR
jgi:hypothetical protein